MVRPSHIRIVKVIKKDKIREKERNTRKLMMEAKPMVRKRPR